MNQREAYERGRRDGREDAEFCELYPHDCRTPEARASYSRGYAESWKARLATIAGARAWKAVAV